MGIDVISLELTSGEYIMSLDRLPAKSNARLYSSFPQYNAMIGYEVVAHSLKSIIYDIFAIVVRKTLDAWSLRRNTYVDALIKSLRQKGFYIVSAKDISCLHNNLFHSIECNISYISRLANMLEVVVKSLRY